MTLADREDLQPIRLPIWQTVVRSFGLTFGQPGALAKVALLPLGLSVLIEGVNESGILGTEAFGIFRFFLLIGLLAFFQIIWLRLLLLRSADGQPGLFNAPGKRFMPFIGYSFLLLLMYVPASFLKLIVAKHEGPAPALSIAIVIVSYLIPVYVNLRFGFAFLWIAVDAPQRLRASWRATRKNGLRLLIAVLLTAVPLFVLSFLLGAGAALSSPSMAAQFETGEFETAVLWVLIVVSKVEIVLYYALACSVLVHAFRVMIGDQQEILERFE